MDQSIIIPGSSTILPLYGEIWHKLIDAYPAAYAFLKGTISFFIVISIPLSVAFLMGIIYCVEQLKRIRKLEKEKFDVKKIEPAFEDVPSQGNKDLTIRWNKVNTLMGSHNQNDWKQAILEADTMLLDVLTGLGYQGDGVGEKLKRVNPGDFKNVQEAWDAHKVRNQIAHDGSYVMTHHEALQTIHRFRKVFEEFYYI